MGTEGGYADTEWGQVHYRRSGGAGPWIGLFHESPLSSRVFEDVLPPLGRHARGAGGRPGLPVRLRAPGDFAAALLDFVRKAAVR
ncbi:hypothetical protein HUT06_17120 [Actinomadura sp. NAK00032]|uniref:alpha/beta fold hydrolase n=1 Tax=Actinomadura sp. NAK00032 TaxID=2742128 RepID=UPI001591020C|nr:hypothetical protein [Actinomadura sp. NAK00032]QKW35544.1 hypothetical protein HUT06_17120 [Actinomadura sp. NAK00032]